MGKLKDRFYNRRRPPMRGMGLEDFKKWMDQQSTKKLTALLIAPMLLPILILVFVHSIALTIAGGIFAFIWLFAGQPTIIHYRWKKHISYRQWQESRMMANLPNTVRKNGRNRETRKKTRRN